MRIRHDRDESHAQRLLQMPSQHASKTNSTPQRRSPSTCPQPDVSNSFVFKRCQRRNGPSFTTIAMRQAATPAVSLQSYLIIRNLNKAHDSGLASYLGFCTGRCVPCTLRLFAGAPSFSLPSDGSNRILPAYCEASALQMSTHRRSQIYSVNQSDTHMLRALRSAHCVKSEQHSEPTEAATEMLARSRV